MRSSRKNTKTTQHEHPHHIVTIIIIFLDSRNHNQVKSVHPYWILLVHLTWHPALSDVQHITSIHFRYFSLYLSVSSLLTTWNHIFCVKLEVTMMIKWNETDFFRTDLHITICIRSKFKLTHSNVWCRWILYGWMIEGENRKRRMYAWPALNWVQGAHRKEAKGFWSF